MSLFSGVMNWTQKTFEPLGGGGLFVLAFIESIFFPVPPDFLLIILCLSNPSYALFYALLASLGSLLGGITGYGIGRYGGLPVLRRLIKEKTIKKAHRLFEKYEAWTIGIAGFTPVPYKVFTLSAGVFYINFKLFVVISAITRSARFFIVATLIMLYGEIIVGFIDKYFNLLSILSVLVLIIFFVLYKKKDEVKTFFGRHNTKK
ncbi:DedA family protein [Candidatus Woesearchaeota archaeon]|nr:DedA family protein [Candidatus Woesearchaeota archaeon]